MKIFKKSIIILIAVVFAVAFSSSAALAGSFAKPTTEAPYGLATSSDAPGLKLAGPLVIEYYNFVSTYKLKQGEPATCNKQVLESEESQARVNLRLQPNDKIIYSYFTEIAPVDMLAPPTHDQGLVTEKLRCRILSDFFGVSGYQNCMYSPLEIKMKSVNNLANLDADTIFTGDTAACTPKIDELDPADNCRQYCFGSKFYILDVVLAVK